MLSPRSPRPLHPLAPGLALLLCTGCGLIDALDSDIIPFGPPIAGDFCENSLDDCDPEFALLVCEYNDAGDPVCTRTDEGRWPACSEAAQRILSQEQAQEQIDEIVVFDATASKNDMDIGTLSQRCVSGVFDVALAAPDREIPEDLIDGEDLRLLVTSDVAQARATGLTASASFDDDKGIWTVDFSQCWGSLANELEPPIEFAVALVTPEVRSNIVCVQILNP